MSSIDHASSLLCSGESAIVVFTEGQFLTMNSDGSGMSGKWVMNPDRHIDKLIIYRLIEEQPRHARVYRANYVDAVQSNSPGRYVIQFKGCEQVGTTSRNWREFADGSTNPIRFVNK